MIRREGMVDYHAAVRINRTGVRYGRGRLLLTLDISNLSGRQVAGIRFSLRARDRNGEVVRCEEEETHVFSLRLNPFEPGMRIVVDHFCDVEREAVGIDLTVEAVHFGDGSMEEGFRPQKKIYFYREIEPDRPKEAEYLRILRDRADRAVCFAEKRNDGWLCTCGRLNKPRNEVCPECLGKRKDLLTRCTREAVLKELKAERALFKRRRLVHRSG